LRRREGSGSRPRPGAVLGRDEARVWLVVIRGKVNGALAFCYRDYFEWPSAAYVRVCRCSSFGSEFFLDANA
jgi:hypothetical protein